MPIDFPVTIIVRHPKENPSKCSIYPLRGREDTQFHTYPVPRPLPLEGYVRLAADGPELSAADRDAGILLLDGSWSWADKMTRAFAHVPPRSLHGYQTAYPRVAKRGTDPGNGLASLEALYIAYHILGRPTVGLLDSYRWAAEFLRLNHFESANESEPFQPGEPGASATGGRDIVIPPPVADAPGSPG